MEERLLIVIQQCSAVVQQCSQYWEVQSLSNADEIATRLFVLVDEIASIIPHMRTSSDQLDTISALRDDLHQLLVMWETKCARLNGQTIILQHGRPRKYINIELVCFFIISQR